MSPKNKEPDTKAATTSPPTYTEPPPPYEPSSQPEVRHRALFERTARIEASTQPRPNPKDLTDEELVKLTLKWVPPPPSARPMSRLRRTVAVPQVDRDSYISGTTPYLRAYAPALEPHGISPTDFLAFCDGLTIAQAPSPPIQVADLVGTGLGFVPDIWAQMTSLGIGIAAGATAEVTNVTRTKLFLKKANAEYFAPRGLKVSVLVDQELQQLLGLAPSYSPLAPIDTRAGCISVTDRRLAALGDHIAPLTTDVPAPTPPSNLIDRLSAKQVQARIQKNRKEAIKKAEKREVREAKRAGRRSTSTPVPALGRQTLLTSTNSLGSPGAQLSHAQSYPYASEKPTSEYPTTPPQPPLSLSQSALEPSPQQLQLQAPLSSPPTNRTLQRLELKKQSINIDADRRLLKERATPSSSKAERVEKDRRKKLAEVDRRIARERRKEEKRAARDRERALQGKPPKKRRDEDSDDSDSDSSSSSDSDSESEDERERRARKEREKDQKTAAKLRWIVVQNLPDEGAFPQGLEE